MFYGQDKKRFDYILMRERDMKLARDVTVQAQPLSIPISGHNIPKAHVRLLGRSGSEPTGEEDKYTAVHRPVKVDE